MFLYTSIEAAVAVIAGIFLAVCTKKAADVTYTKLDKAGRITNILLIPVYVCLAPLYLFLGMIASPRYDGLLGILGWIVAIIMGSAALFSALVWGSPWHCAKKGRSKPSFAVQFAGVLGIAIDLILFFLFYGDLLRPLN